MTPTLSVGGAQSLLRSGPVGGRERSALAAAFVLGLGALAPEAMTTRARGTATDEPAGDKQRCLRERGLEYDGERT